MDCKRVEKLISDYQNGRLDAETHAMVDQHLAHCSHCRSFLKKETTVTDFLKKATKYEPDSSVANAFFEKIKVIEVQNRHSERTMMTRFSPLKWLLVFLILGLFAALAYFIFPRPDQQINYFSSYGETGFTWTLDPESEHLIPELHPPEKYSTSLGIGGSLSALSGAHESDEEKAKGRVTHTFDLSNDSDLK